MSVLKSTSQANGMKAEPSPSMVAGHASPAAPTGYRVTLVPGGLEVSARLNTVEEINTMVRLLRASTVFIEQTADGDMDVPLNLTQRLDANGAHAKQA